jgi:predicted permease
VERSTRNALVVSQVAICVLLLTVSALCARTLWNLKSLDAGFVREQVLVADVQPPPGRSPAQNLQLLDDLRRQIAALPDVQGVAFSQMGQLSGFGIEGTINPVDASAPEEAIHAYRLPASDDFLTAVGTPLLEGRPFDGRDRADSPAVAIVNESFVRRVFAGRRAIGQRFREGDPESGRMIEVVGVAQDANWINLRESPSPMYYRPIVQAPALARPRFAVRASGDLDVLAAAFVRTARALDPRVLVDNVVPMTAVVDRSLARERMAAHLSALVALLAALIACIGIYGVLSHDVAQRTREIGIRSALGARRAAVIGLILRQGLVPTTIGITVGMAAAAATTRYLDALLFGITPLDLPTYGAVAGAFAALAALACYVPARRATQVDPVTALRVD